MTILPKIVRSVLARSFLLLVPCTLFGADASTAPAPGDLKVMSYNIRYGTADDKENAWDNRKEFLADTVTAFDPDLLGTQETLKFQRDFLSTKLKGHDVLAVGRDDGKEKGEMTAVFWRKDRFEKLDGGHFWLSTTSDVAGSMSWDTSLTRMATWVKLKDKSREGKQILWLNTHFDHRGRIARLESAKLIRERIGTLGKDCSIIVTGDFNSAEGSEPYVALFGTRENSESPVVDTLRIAKPTRTEDEGTTTPFLATPSTTARIDWIAVSHDWKVITAGIERPNREGRTASDHFPVYAILRR